MPVIRPPRSLALTISLTGIGQIIVALTIAAIVQLHLRLVDVAVVGRVAFVTPGQCLLGPAGAMGSTCYYAYTVAAASVFASFAVSLLRCARVPWGLWLEVSFASACVGWWLVAASVFTNKGAAADRAALPAAGWRHAVVALAWVEVALFIALAAAYAGLARWARTQAASLAAAAAGGVGGVEMGGMMHHGAPPPPPPPYGGGPAFFVPGYGGAAPPAGAAAQPPPPVQYAFAPQPPPPAGAGAPPPAAPAAPLPAVPPLPTAAAAAPAAAAPPAPPPAEASGNPFAPK